MDVESTSYELTIRDPDCKGIYRTSIVWRILIKVNGFDNREPMIASSAACLSLLFRIMQLASIKLLSAFQKGGSSP